MLREAAPEYASAQVRERIAVLMWISEDGNITVWQNPRVAGAPGAQSMIDIWVRLQVIRGRSFAIFPLDDMLQHAVLVAEHVRAEN